MSTGYEICAPFFSTNIFRKLFALISVQFQQCVKNLWVFMCPIRLFLYNQNCILPMNSVKFPSIRFHDSPFRDSCDFTRGKPQTEMSNIMGAHFVYYCYEGRAVWGMNSLRPLKNWGHEFESHWRHRCLCALFCVYVVLRTDSGLATGWSPVQGVLPTIYSIKKLKSGQSPTWALEP
jgi:hypothetical protein